MDGKRLWRSVKEPIEEYQEHTDRLCGYEICRSTDGDNRFVYKYKYKLDNSNDWGVVDKTWVEDFYKIKEEMKTKLEPLGLWGELEFGQFGIHTVLVCSY